MPEIISPGFESQTGLDLKLAPITRAALAIFLTALPLTHAAGLVAHAPRTTVAKAAHLLMYPFVGGRLHAIFHTLSWVVWGISLTIAAPVMLSSQVPASHVEALLGAAATGAVFALLFMIKGLLVFDPHPGPRANGRDSTSGELATPDWNKALLPTKGVASGVVASMGVCWAVMGGALLYIMPYLENRHSQAMYCAMSALCLVVGATTTHGVAGAIHNQKSDGWRFWQPFLGGPAFVATQGLGWALFALALASVVGLGRQLALGVASAVRSWLLATSALGLLAQVLLAVSVWVWRGRQITERVVEAVSPSFRGKQNLPDDFPKAPLLTVWLPILMLYAPVHVLVAAAVVTFMVVPTPVAMAAWVGGLVVYYGCTSSGSPEHTGSREWPAYQQWVTANIEAALLSWFGTVEVLREGSHSFDPAVKYMFGYCPHGLFPIGLGYLPLMPGWKALLPGIRPAPLTASVVFQTPLIRDLVCWAGFRQVSRSSFVKALRLRRSVLFVPGGQAELVHTHRASAVRQEWVVCTHHKGFVRLAIEEQAALVPVVVFGEVDCLRNFINLPRLQAWTYKKLGFPIPYLVVGRWGISPLPRATGLRFIIGEPITPSAHVAGQAVDQNAVDELHASYYEQVKMLFHKHRTNFPGYENVQLVFASS